MKNYLAKALWTAALSTIAIAPASAAPVALEVNYGDLDLTSPAGAEKLAQRVEAQIDDACERPFIRNLNAMRSYEDCKSAVREKVADQLPQPAALASL